MDHIEERINGMGFILPEPPKTLGSYVPCIITGNLLFFSGVIPMKEGNAMTGRFGGNLTVNDAKEVAAYVVLSILANIKASIGGLDRIKRFIKIEGYITSTEDFFDQPKVLNEVSNLIVEIFGDPGKHSRVAVGVYSLPLKAAIEVSGIVEINREII